MGKATGREKKRSVSGPNFDISDHGGNIPLGQKQERPTRITSEREGSTILQVTWPLRHVKNYLRRTKKTAN